MAAEFEEILSEWLNNLAFREEFKKDPAQALKNAGFELSPEDLIKVQNQLSTLDEVLDPRTNK